MALYFRLLDDLEKWLKEVETALASDDVGKDLGSVQVPPRGLRDGGPSPADAPCARGCACRTWPVRRN